MALTRATGTAERAAAEEMIVRYSPGARRITLGADKGYDAAAFVADLRALNVTPHIAQNNTGRRSAVDARTTRHPGYAVSQQKRKRIEEPFGWRCHGGLKAGMTKWEGSRANTLRLLVDIRWLFPDAHSATAYHLATLRAKSEGKPENQTAQKIGDNCHIYSFPSGQELAVAQGIFAWTLGDGNQMARGIGRAIAEMPDDAFIYLFTKGPVAVKCFAVLGSSPTAIETRKSAVHVVAERIVSRIDGAFPNGASNRPAVWWKKLFSI